MKRVPLKNSIYYCEYYVYMLGSRPKSLFLAWKIGAIRLLSLCKLHSSYGENLKLGKTKTS